MRLKKQNPYIFLMIWIRNEAPMRFEKWIHEEFGKKIVQREDEQSQKFEGKLKRGLKTAPVSAKHAIFAT